MTTTSIIIFSIILVLIGALLIAGSDFIRDRAKIKLDLNTLTEVECNRRLDLALHVSYWGVSVIVLGAVTLMMLGLGTLWAWVFSL